MLRIPHCLDNRLTDWQWGCQPRAPAALYSSEILFSSVLISLRDGVNPRGLVRLERLGKSIKISHLIRIQTHDFPAYSVVP
jgi:hypothetical protein